jgi:predicted AAA+ superfamily ATPase
MIPRRALTAVQNALSRQAAVALIGPRQVGKTTLSHAVAAGTPSIYLDLEASEDRAKLADLVSRAAQTATPSPADADENQGKLDARSWVADSS